MCNPLVVAQEIMISNFGIQECIANEKKTSEIPHFIVKGHEVSGMQTFDQHLAALVNGKLVTMETAMAFASNPADFQRNFQFGSAGTEGDIPNGSLSLENAPGTESPAIETAATPPPTPPGRAAPTGSVPQPTKAPPLPWGAPAAPKPIGTKTGTIAPPKIPKLPNAA
jgi:hypothetical protein